MNYLMWLLRTEFASHARVVCALNHWDIYSAPENLKLFIECYHLALKDKYFWDGEIDGLLSKDSYNARLITDVSSLEAT